MYVLNILRLVIGADFSPDSDQIIFSLDEALLWILSSPDVN